MMVRKPIEEIKQDEAVITPAVEVYCSKHPDCCSVKGCPGLFKHFPSGNSVWDGTCCY
jgi:hypothetical protein